MANGISRRHFFYGTLLAGAIPSGGFGSTKSLKFLGYKSPNEKLNIAAIGAGGKGGNDIDGVATENIVALADPDWKKAASTFNEYSKAVRYKDYRQMLEKEKNIDAVTVSTPDHTHAPAAIWAMRMGKHVYCQKPLARTVWEIRQMVEAGRKYGVSTQMGNQGYSNLGARQCCEMIWHGDIGNVTEVHAWTNRPVWPQGEVATPGGPVPETLDWDLWLGTSAQRPYSEAYLPFNWRGFHDFGAGALGDMACHILGTPNMALRLTAPTSVECVKQEGKGNGTFPKKSIIKFQFPARGSMPPVTVTWYDGLEEPPVIQGVPADEHIGDRKGANGSLFVGDKGMITTGCYGAETRLVPESKMKDYEFPPEILSRSPGHYRDWIRACKGGEPACSNFNVAGPFTEWVLLGVIATRVEGKLEWDAAKMRFTNNSAANQYLKPYIRKGWKFV